LRAKEVNYTVGSDTYFTQIDISKPIKQKLYYIAIERRETLSLLFILIILTFWALI